MAELHSPAISIFSFIINMMRYTEKVYSSSLFACASLRKIPFYLEGTGGRTLLPPVPLF